MTTKIPSFLLITFLIAAASAWASDGIDGVLTSLKADDLAVVQAGEEVYRANCAACHGAQLEGQANWRERDAGGYLLAPPHDATGHTWHHSDDLLFEIVKYGPGKIVNDPEYKTRMPVYEGILSDDEIIAVLSFIKHSWPDEERIWQEKTNGKNNFKILNNNKPTLLDKLLGN